MAMERGMGRSCTDTLNAIIFHFTYMCLSLGIDDWHSEDCDNIPAATVLAWSLLVRIVRESLVGVVLMRMMASMCNGK